jgi:hypothetical protein
MDHNELFDHLKKAMVTLEQEDLVSKTAEGLEVLPS